MNHPSSVVVRSGKVLTPNYYFFFFFFSKFWPKIVLYSDSFLKVFPLLEVLFWFFCVKWVWTNILVHIQYFIILPIFLKHIITWPFIDDIHLFSQKKEESVVLCLAMPPHMKMNWNLLLEMKFIFLERLKKGGGEENWEGR